MSANKKVEANRISSPAATGGAGTLFEQHVDAYWLAQLLLRATPPILLDCTVAEIHLQTERLGWNTDDFLVIGERSAGSSRKLAGQVKRSFTVSATNDDCKKAIEDFWKDFNEPQRFLPDTDRFAVVVQRGSSALLKHLVGLLDCARASRDGSNFERRLGTAGLVTATAVTHCTEIRKIIAAYQGREITVSDVWPFLRVLYVIHLDLQTSTAQHEALIKTSLAHTTAERDALGAAHASWNELLAIAGGGMAAGLSFGWKDLPEDLRRRHSVFGGPEQQTLRALSDHTIPVLRAIRSTIGRDLHLQRATFVQQVIHQLESYPVVLLSGPAGSGKSAIAKEAISFLSADYFTFGFRAEELAQPHFDATLQNAQIPANTGTVQVVLASQDKKIIFVDSVERLLEKSTRDAFGDLLGLAATDKSIRILLTCRDYSTDLVRDCFLRASDVDNLVIDVPHLSDDELSEVQAAYPTLAAPLANDKLRRILRKPYVLDKALQISWPPDRPLPESEREFRALFWQQIIRADQSAANGMPQRREHEFEEIALRRARGLIVYVTAADLDAAVVESLRRDGVIISSEASPVLVAPAHDILEDWALLRWIEQEHAKHNGVFRDLATSIGPHPAVRRAYRSWVAELLDRDSNAADRLFHGAVVESTVPARFCDDTLVCLLRAPTAAAFIERNTAYLLADDQKLLRRVIHLLRVACVTAPAWMPASQSHTSLFNVPTGPAWPAVLNIVAKHREAFGDKDHMLLLGLIEDWARGVAYWSPYPEGAEAATAIAHSLLPGYAAYRDESPGTRIMQVIAKIPLAARAAFEVLMRGADKDERDRASEEFRDLIFSGMEGTAAGRDVPDIVIETAEDYFLCQEDDLHEDRFYGMSLDLEPTFGIKPEVRHDYFPPSALRGPWIQLLRSHPDKGIAFFIKAFNHSIDWYAHPRVNERIEPPIEIELTLADGTTRKQWINDRLWRLYRGTTVGPYVLQSLLMAFERWLFEYAKTYPDKLDTTLVDILSRSENAALTAVVASVATAYPHSSGEALLVLLSSPLCIALDKQRMATESGSMSAISGLLPGRAENEVYNQERKSSDAMAHRRSDLEEAVAKLQLGLFAPRVHELLDRHRATLPPLDQQTEEHRRWRLAMHRMDLRQYTMSEIEDAEETPSTENEAPAGHRRLVRLDLKEPDPDITQMVSTTAARFNAMNARLGLQMWAYKVFKHEDGHDPSAWRERLAAAQAPSADEIPDPNEPDFAAGGPGIVAAVCVRDHWDEMSNEDRVWCVRRICSEVLAHANEWNDLQAVQRYDMAPDRACAYTLAVLWTKPLTDPQRAGVQVAFAAALTHSIQEVKWHATWGVAEQLWTTDPALAIRCVNALAMEATAIQKEEAIQKKRPYNNRRQMESIKAEAASVVQKAFWEKDGIPTNAYETLDITDWFGAEADTQILTILLRAPNEPMAIAGFARAARNLVACWDSDESRRERSRDRNYENEMAISQRIQNFVMSASPTSATSVVRPILDAVDRHPREIHWFVRGLISVEDGQKNTPQFWLLWNLFAERVRTAPWLQHVDARYPVGGEMISAIFLGSSWKDHVRHWKSLEGYANQVDKLFEDLPATATVLEDYVRYLYHVGEQSIPGAFVLILECLRLGDARKMLSSSNTIFLLETLLVRNVYGKPMELKRDSSIREAVLGLLDLLVEMGSSAAFRMRDDFVTPASE